MQVKTIDMLKEGTLLPPKKGTCQKCASEHEERMPHNQQSLFWQYWFRKQEDRWPTWSDAMAHCTLEMKDIWIGHLKKHGITADHNGKAYPGVD